MCPEGRCTVKWITLRRRVAHFLFLSAEKSRYDVRKAQGWLAAPVNER